MGTDFATRVISDKHEKSVCKALNGRQTPNSGAGKFEKSDVVVENASLLVECKCSIKQKYSFGIKEEWIKKVSEEAFRNRLNHVAICFNYEPNGNNYYVITESLMKYLVSKLSEEEES